MKTAAKSSEEPVWKELARTQAKRLLNKRNAVKAEAWINASTADQLPEEYGAFMAELLLSEPKHKKAFETPTPPPKVDGAARANELVKLAGKKQSLEDDKDTLLKLLLPNVRPIIATLDLEAWVEQVRDWFNKTLQAKPVQIKLEAILFALWEMSHAVQFDLGLFGTRKYEGKDGNSDWYDWEPKSYYSGFKGAKGLWKKLEKADEEAWSVIFGLIIIVVRAYVSRNKTEFQKITGVKMLTVLAGFVEGDLFEVAV